MLIISDLHLQVGRPDITAQFLDFLAGPTRHVDRLMILGDLFEQWVGDDAIGDFEREVASALAATADAGVRIDFIAGNRDFLLGDAYCRLAGMQRLEEPLQMKLAGRNAVLLHGDVLCTDDRAYQRFRARVRDKEWQRRMLARPAFLRRGMARILRVASRIRTRRAAPEIMDVNEDAVRTCLRSHRANLMIHGHTHRPDVHQVDLADHEGPAQRYVLGDWFDHGSVIEIHEDGVELRRLARD